VTLQAPVTLKDKIADRSAHVCIIGLGYVGLTTMVAAAQAGFRVTGIDLDQDRVDQLNRGGSYIDDVDQVTLEALLRDGLITASTDPRSARDTDVVIICVPTPLNKNKEPLLDPIRDSATDLAGQPNSLGKRLVILQSTTYPGTTEELVLPILSKDGLRVGEDFFLAFSPERIDPGNSKHSVRDIPKVVGGVTAACTDMASFFLAEVADEVRSVSSPRVGEMTKLLENIFRSVNIALVNELMMLCERLGIDIWEVIDSASTKPFGFMPFYPGAGVGGHCIPVDPFYLAWKARESDFYVNFIQLAAQVNDNMPYYIESRIADILAERGLLLNRSEVLLLGVTFKRDVQDTRNSPAIALAQLLLRRGTRVSFNDPFVTRLSIGGDMFERTEASPETLRAHDATVLLVPHSSYDVVQIVKHSPLVIDVGNATGYLGELPNVIRIGAPHREQVREE
jgi:UDP-N-acetyl-D-glucosamine dehydrogenase